MNIPWIDISPDDSPIYTEVLPFKRKSFFDENLEFFPHDENPWLRFQKPSIRLFSGQTLKIYQTPDLSFEWGSFLRIDLKYISLNRILNEDTFDVLPYE